jgi:NAD(P)-dependent dehydrogenase (short-subunit alcohol dehydrogenase family)
LHGTFGAMADDRVVLVTGGGSGIGRATAQRAARDGAAIAVVDRNGDGAAETVELIERNGGRAITLGIDVADDDAVGTAVNSAFTRFGRITGVVTAAGIFHGPDLQPLHKVTVDTFQHVIAVNLQGTFSVLRHTLPHLSDGGGSVVTVASTAAIRGHGYGAGYTASKGGVDALTRLVAVQYGASGVRANCVCPGGVDTPMTAGTFSSPEAQERARKRIPIGRYAQPEDLADVIAFLLSDDARYVTGQTIPVEGGATIA